MRLKSSVLTFLSVITFFIGAASVAQAETTNPTGNPAIATRLVTDTKNAQLDPLPPPPGCVSWVDLTKYPNRVQTYYGGGSCRTCERFGNEGIINHWWTDFKCWMVANGGELIVELWTNGPR
jgi:hypothetical protein